MKKKAASTIEVKIGMYNEHPRVVSVKAGASVQDVLDEAGIELGSSESIWVEGELAADSDTVENGDNLQIVGKKEGGSR